jgi:hypothetical protein
MKRVIVAVLVVLFAGGMVYVADVQAAKKTAPCCGMTR